jgi:hypothetical protein
VKKARNEDLYLCITESKKRVMGEDEAPQFEKHKLFLYKEDFAHFAEGLQDVMKFVEDQLGTIDAREEWHPENEDAEEKNEDPSAEQEESKRKGLLGLFK